MSVVTFVGAGPLAAVTSGDLTLDVPSGVQYGDLLVAVWVFWGPNSVDGDAFTSFDLPIGWDSNFYSVKSIATNDGVAGIATHIYGGGESSATFSRNLNWDTGTDTCWAGLIFAVRGVPPTDLFIEAPEILDDTTAYDNSGTDSSVEYVAVDVAGSDRLLLAIHAVTDDQTVSSGPSGYTLGTSQTTTTGTSAAIAVYYKQDVSSDGAVSATLSGAPVAGGWASWHLAIKPTYTAKTASDTYQVSISESPNLAVITAVSDTDTYTASVEETGDVVNALSDTDTYLIGLSEGEEFLCFVAEDDSYAITVTESEELTNAVSDEDMYQVLLTKEESIFGETNDGDTYTASIEEAGGIANMLSDTDMYLVSSSEEETPICLITEGDSYTLAVTENEELLGLVLDEDVYQTLLTEEGSLFGEATDGDTYYMTVTEEALVQPIGWWLGDVVSSNWREAQPVEGTWNTRSRANGSWREK